MQDNTNSSLSGAPKNVEEFLCATSDKIRSVIKDVLDTNPEITKLVNDLRSLGVMTLIDADLKVRCLVVEGFVPPTDLSCVSEETLDKLFSDEDLQMLRNMSGD